MKLIHLYGVKNVRNENLFSYAPQIAQHFLYLDHYLAGSAIQHLYGFSSTFHSIQPYVHNAHVIVQIIARSCINMQRPNTFFFTQTNKQKYQPEVKNKYAPIEKCIVFSVCMHTTGIDKKAAIMSAMAKPICLRL